jgi:hypothetical protein
MLNLIARHGRLILIAGLVAGAALPDLAEAMKPLITPMVVFLLFLAAVRVDPIAALPRGRARNRAVAYTFLTQTALPLALMGVFWSFGALGQMIAVGVVLTLAGAPITGSTGLTILSRADPTPALRQTVLGTALLPLTVLPVFWLMPVFGAPSAVLGAAARLLAMIVLAGGAAIVLRRTVPWVRQSEGQSLVDGLMTVIMALVVIGLMAEVGPALRAADPRLGRVVTAVFLLSFVTQIAVFWALRRSGAASVEEAPGLAVAAGNRNLALFLGIVPTDTLATLLLFVGCYQVPMYLTPLLMGPIFRRWGGALS